MDIEQRYALSKEFPIGKLNESFDNVWAELADKNSGIREKASNEGIPEEILDELVHHKRREVFQVKQAGAGLDPATTAILIGIGTGIITKVASDLASKAITSLWTKVIFPRIQDKVGKLIFKKDQKNNESKTEAK